MQDDPRLRALRARLGAGSGVAKPSDPRLDALRARTGGQTSAERIQGTELPTVGEGFVPPATPEAPYSPTPGPGVEAIEDLFNTPGYRLGAGQTAARGLVRQAGQQVAGAGQTLQALPAHIERVAGRGDFRADQPQSRTEALLQGGKDLLAGPGRVAGDASRMIGRMLEQGGESYMARFPAEERLTRPTQGPTGPMQGAFPGEEPFQPFGEGAPRSRLGAGVDISNPNWWINVAAESIGQIGSQLALATMTGGAGPVVQFMAFAGPTMAIEAGGAYRENFDRFEQEFREANRREPTEAELEEMDQRAAGVAMIRGAGAMALDKLPYGAILRRRSPQAEQLFLRRFAERMAQEPNIGAILIRGAGAEAFTEAAQEVWGAVVQDLVAEDPDAWEDIAGRIFTGAVGGAAGGGFAGATQVPAERAQARAWRDALQFIPPDPEAPAGEAPGGPQEPSAPPTAPAPRPEPVAPAEPPAAAAPEAPTAKPPRIKALKARVEEARRRLAEVVDPSVKEELAASYRDDLTGLANEKAWSAARPRAEADPAQRVVVADLSNFKAINDQEGMDAGDAFLREVADVARAAAEAVGLPPRNVFRPKGDEFMAIGSAEQAEAFAAEFRKRFPERKVGKFTVRARVGVGQTFVEADQAQAKEKKAETGPRNRDMQAEGSAPPPAAPPVPGGFEVTPTEGQEAAPVQDISPRPPVSQEVPGDYEVGPDFEADLDIDAGSIPADLELPEDTPAPSRAEALAQPKAPDMATSKRVIGQSQQAIRQATTVEGIRAILDDAERMGSMIDPHRRVVEDMGRRKIEELGGEAAAPEPKAPTPSVEPEWGYVLPEFAGKPAGSRGEKLAKPKAEVEEPSAPTVPEEIATRNRQKEAYSVLLGHVRDYDDFATNEAPNPTTMKRRDAAEAKIRSMLDDPDPTAQADARRALKIIRKVGAYRLPDGLPEPEQAEESGPKVSWTKADIVPTREGVAAVEQVTPEELARRDAERKPASISRTGDQQKGRWDRNETIQDADVVDTKPLPGGVPFVVGDRIQISEPPKEAEPKRLSADSANVPPAPQDIERPRLRFPRKVWTDLVEYMGGESRMEGFTVTEGPGSSYWVVGDQIAWGRVHDLLLIGQEASNDPESLVRMGPGWTKRRIQDLEANFNRYWEKQTDGDGPVPGIPFYDEQQKAQESAAPPAPASPPREGEVRVPLTAKQHEQIARVVGMDGGTYPDVRFEGGVLYATPNELDLLIDDLEQRGAPDSDFIRIEGVPPARIRELGRMLLKKRAEATAAPRVNLAAPPVDAMVGEMEAASSPPQQEVTRGNDVPVEAEAPTGVATDPEQVAGVEGDAGEGSGGLPQPDRAAGGGDVPAAVAVDPGDVPGEGDATEAADRPERSRKPRDAGSDPASGPRGAVPRRVDFQLPEGELELGGPKTRLRNNIAAIKLVQQLHEKGEQATPEQQAVLAKFVGWGGIPQVFEQWVRREYENEQKELQALLTKEEWEAAKRNTLNAHYTSLDVVRALWDGVAAMGIESLQNPVILEPSAGIGHFIGARSNPGMTIMGVELDPWTARIASQLYPNHPIRQADFGKLPITDNSVDVAISNVPFGETAPYDPRYKRFKGLTLHDYFFLKTMDKLRPGGVAVFITSMGTMDKKGPKVREALAAQADLVAAYRLPNTAFRDNAATEVTTDVVILRKRLPEEEASGPAWTKVVEFASPDGTLKINEYFATNPNNMLGRMGLEGTMYRRGSPALTEDPRRPLTWKTELRQAMKALPSDTIRPGRRAVQAASAVASASRSLIGAGATEGKFVLSDSGKTVLRIVNGKPVGQAPTKTDPTKQRPVVPSTQQDKVRLLIGLRDQHLTVLETQLQDGVSAQKQAAERKKLSDLHDQFVKKYGPINKEEVVEATEKREAYTKYPNLDPFKGDPQWAFVAALERWDPSNRQWVKADVQQKRVLAAVSRPETAETAKDALALVLAEKGQIDIPRVAALSGKSEQEALAELRGEGLVFPDPASGELVLRHLYLSGNVVEKLRQAEEAMASNGGLDERFENTDPDMFARNVEELKAVQPKRLEAAQVTGRLGANWIPWPYVQSFLHHLGASRNEASSVTADFVGGKWVVEGLGNVNRVPELEATYTVQPQEAPNGEYTTRIPFSSIFTAAITGGGIAAWYPVDVPGSDKPKKVKHPQGTLMAKDKVRQLQQEFQRWIFEDKKRAEKLLDIYNDTFNNLVPPTFDGSHLTFEGMAEGWADRMYPWQRDAVWRVLTTGNTLLAHLVGAGKTNTMVAAGMEGRRMGLWKKPAYVVPNHLVVQFSNEFLHLYPNARILTGDGLTDAADRVEFQVRIASGEWDAVIMAHSTFQLLAPSPSLEREVVEMELSEIEELLSAHNTPGREKSATVKQIEKAKVRLEKKLEELLDIRVKDDTIYFDQLGIDQLFVDESHTYKNLFINTSVENMAKKGSGRAADLYAKAQWFNRNKPGWGMVFASGTPVSNSFGEMFTIQRYLQPQVLADAGISSFDAWVRAYAETVSAAEYNVDGTFSIKTRYSRFVNVGDLVAQFRQVADVVYLEDMEAIMASMGKKVNRPTMKGGKPEVIVAPRSALTDMFLKDLKKRADRIRAQQVSSDEDNYLKLSGDGRKAALDFRLMYPDVVPVEPKVEKVAENVHRIWEETAEKRLTQLVFIDFSSPSSQWGKTGGPKKQNRKRDEDDESGFDFGAGDETSRFSAYDEIKRLLIEKGIPENEIAFMHDYTKDAAKATIFAAVRAGRVRVLLGSRERMGAGTNVQNLGIAIHQVDPPWRPSDMAQALGRFIRAGNSNQEVSEYIYVSEGTYDAPMFDGLRRKESMVVTLIRSGRDVRTVEDMDTMVLTYAMIAAITTGKPEMQRLVKVREEIQDLQRAWRSYEDSQRRARERVMTEQGKVRWLEGAIEKAAEDGKILPPPMPMQVTFKKQVYDLDKIGEVLEKYLRDVHSAGSDLDVILGSVGEFKLGVRSKVDGVWGSTTTLYLQGRTEATYGTQWTVGSDIVAGGIGTRIVNLTTKPRRDLEEYQSRLAVANRAIEDASRVFDNEFEREDELAALQAEEIELVETLNLDEVDEGNVDVNGEEAPDPDDDAPSGGMGRGGFLVNPFARTPKKPIPPLFRSTFAGVEERMAAARGIRSQPLFERVKKAAADVRATMTRRQPLLDTKGSTIMGGVNDLLRFEEGSGDWAKAVAYHEISNIVKDLNPAELDLFTRALILPDMVKDIEAGRYGDVSEAGIAARAKGPEGAPAPAKPLPYGYPSEEAVREDLELVEAEVGRHSRVAEAVDRRREFAGNLTRRLVANELLPPEVLDDQRYYHRQVMEYFHLQDFGGTGTMDRDVRLHEKGFQKGRSGGGDFNTAFEQAEFEWVAQALVLLARKEALERIESLANIQSRLKREAKAANLAAIAAMYKVDEGGKDPLAIYRGRIGMALAELAKLAEEGELDVSMAMQEVLTEMREEMERHRDEAADGNEAPFQFSHPRFFELLADLLNTGGSGARSAGVIFKAIREREAFIKEKLGPQYRTWRRLIPEGYVTWQPKKGHHFFMGLTVEERILEKAREEDRALTTEEVKTAMIRGGRRQEWVIPAEIAATLDKIRPDLEVNAIEDAWTQVQQSWKQWVLLNPVRFLRYNLNNSSGDIDVAFAYDPKIVTKYAVQAAKDLHAHMKNRADSKVSAEILHATKLQVMGGLRLAEIQDISQAGIFSRFDRENASATMQAVDKYWKSVRDFTDWRENVLRLAAYRYFLDKLNANPGGGVYGASKRYEVDAIQRTDEKAAKLARELIGDYGDISRGGQWIRRRLIPFYSWIEINAPRYARLLANARHEEDLKGRNGRLAGVAAKKGAGAVLSLGVRAHILYILTALWNRIFFGDEDEELRGQHKGHHIILGRRDDGTIVSLRFEGALSDALSWFNLADWMKDAADLAEGDKDLADMAHEAAKAPIERIINSLEPVTKTIFELSMGQRTYPNIFEGGSSWRRRNQPIRDPVEHALGTVSLNRLYSRVTGKPQRQDQFLTGFNLPGAAIGGAAGAMMMGPAGAVAGALLGTMLTYQTDPGEAAYWETRGKVYRYLEEQDVASGGATPTARSNALYYYRRAAAWGDEKAQSKWLQEYYRLGGRPANLQQSLQRAAPLAVLPARHRRAFLVSLSEEDRQVLEMAERWYQATIASPGRTR